MYYGQKHSHKKTFDHYNQHNPDSTSPMIKNIIHHAKYKNKLNIFDIDVLGVNNNDQQLNYKEIISKLEIMVKILELLLKIIIYIYLFI